jgi:peptide-methionine (R)-S-oxide reductase
MMSMLQRLDQRITRRALLASTTMAAAVSVLRAEGTEPEVTIVEFNNAGEKTGVVQVKKIRHTEAEWRKMLTLQQYYVTRKETSDLAFYGTYFKLTDPGLYRCLCCGTAAFSSDAKFESKTGFPCFTAPVAEENIRISADPTDEQKRVNVQCKRCDAHLGYLYDDGPEPTHKRYCMNESSLKFVPRQKSGAGA